jgi:hypothetical protein
MLLRLAAFIVSVDDMVIFALQLPGDAGAERFA